LRLDNEKRTTIVSSKEDNNNDHFLITKRIFSTPYVRSISESFSPITKKYDFDVAYSVPNTLNKFIRRGTDKIDSMSQKDCVYKISCLNCDTMWDKQKDVWERN